MCGRFQLSFDEEKKQTAWLMQFYPELESLHHIMGERFPTQDALTIVLKEKQLIPSIKKWGVKVEGLPLIINARCETVSKKALFQPMLERRCVIVASGFYEWKQTAGMKQKYLIQGENRYQFLAGLYNAKQEFVILTCKSHGEMASYHDRCPVILQKDEIAAYLQFGVIPAVHQVFRYTKCEPKE